MTTKKINTLPDVVAHLKSLRVEGARDDSSLAACITVLERVHAEGLELRAALGRTNRRLQKCMDEIARMANDLAEGDGK